MRAGWSKRSLGDVATIYNGNSINAEEKKKKYLGQTQGLPFIATKDVGNDGVIDYENGVRIPNYTDFKIAHPDSVFVCAEGGSAGKKVAFIEQKVCFGNKLFALQPKKALLNGRYLYYFVQSQAFKEQFKQLITGIIGGVSSKKFKEIPIILSPLPEQQRIVDILDREFAKIDALKANAEKSLQAAKDLFQSSLDAKVFAKDGSSRLLSSVCLSITDGDHMPPPKSNSGIPFITISNINKNKYEVDFTDTFFVPETYFHNLKGDRKPKRGDVLYTVTGSFGIPVVVSGEKDFCFQRHIALIRPNQSIVLPEFVFYWAMTRRVLRLADEVATGTAQRTVSLSSLRNFPIPVLGLDEQKTIVGECKELFCSGKVEIPKESDPSALLRK